MTGLNPPEHGVRDNGVSSLPADVPTLAAVLSGRGYTTAAFVSSRVLDRRFGLDRGFALYDDAMVAERVGEQGYPERGAAAVTDAALAWAAAAAARPAVLSMGPLLRPARAVRPAGRLEGRFAGRAVCRRSRVHGPRDRTAARQPAGDAGRPHRRGGRRPRGDARRARREGARHLSLPVGPRGSPRPFGARRPRRPLRSARGSARARCRGPCSASLGLSAEARPSARRYPGLAWRTRRRRRSTSETLLPATAYGWSPLEAATDERYRLISAPRPELYDLEKDPAETHNLSPRAGRTHGGSRRSFWKTRRRPGPLPPSPPPSSPSRCEASAISRARARGAERGWTPRTASSCSKNSTAPSPSIRAGMPGEAVRQLALLVEKNPGNVPFLVRLGEAQVAAGNPDAALKTMEAAVALNPQLDFLHAHMARLHADARRYARARAEWEAALELNPRYALAWLGLAGLAGRDGGAKAELEVLRKARPRRDAQRRRPDPDGRDRTGLRRPRRGRRPRRAGRRAHARDAGRAACRRRSGGEARK